MTTYRMHGSPISPYARKAMILARLHGIDLDILPASATGDSGYTNGDNPLGKIPSLEWKPGQWLFDSAVICEWLDAKGASPTLGKGEMRWVHLWQAALGDGISDATYNLRYEMARPEELHWPQMIARHEHALRASVDVLESIVGSLGKPWTFGNVAIVAGLDYMEFRAGHLDWKARAPHLALWHEAFAETDAYRETFAYESA